MFAIVIFCYLDLIPLFVCVCVCLLTLTGKSYGEQAQWNDGQRKSLHPRTADKLHGTHCHANLQVCIKNFHKSWCSLMPHLLANKLIQTYMVILSKHYLKIFKLIGDIYLLTNY